MNHPSAAIYGVAGQTLTEEERRLFTATNPLGLILFARNITSPSQVKALIDAFKECVHHPQPLILVDQEGGRVARFKPPHWRVMPPAGVFASLAEHDRETAEEAITLNYRLMADELQPLGINVNCAPMLDILFDHSDDIIGDRALGSKPEQVIALAKATCRGLLEGGVLPVIKHIPGHGRATVDSHKELPVVDASLEAMEQTDFIPFRALADMPLGMTAHIRYTALDAERCATESPDVIQFIRQELGFDGLLMSDDVSMKALTGGFDARANRALEAGCDLVLHCNGRMEEMQQLAAHIPALTEEGQARLEKALTFLKPPEAFNAEAAAARYERISASIS